MTKDEYMSRVYIYFLAPPVYMKGENRDGHQLLTLVMTNR